MADRVHRDGCRAIGAVNIRGERLLCSGVAGALAHQGTDWNRRVSDELCH